MITIEHLSDGQYSIQVVRGHSEHTKSDSDTHRKSSAVQLKVQEYGRFGFLPATIKATLVDKAISKEEAEATGMSKVTGKDVNNWLRGITPGNSKDYGATNKNQALSELLLHMDVSDA